MTTTTTRPCWQCGRQHESNTVPALCSVVCIAAWQQRYQVQHSEPSPVLVELAACAKDIRQAANQTLMNLAEQFAEAGRQQQHTNHDCDPVPVTGAEAVSLERVQRRRAMARKAVLQLHSAGCLGYLAASQEWVDETLTPLGGRLSRAADELALDGQLPEFAEWFPAPTEDNRDFAIEEPRPADEPQDLVDADRYCGTVGSIIGVPIPAVCPPRPPEPPVTKPNNSFVQAFVDLFNALPEVITLLRRWFRRG